MGVPGFFMWLLKQYKTKKIVFQKSDDSMIIDYILIDMNCMIHPECFKTLDTISITDIEKIEAKMRTNIITYLEKIINYAVPKKGIYIAIDGVAPVAKMKQQRLRRFKSISDRDLYSNLRKKHNKVNPFFWNNSAITPGTNFMRNLHNVITDWAKNYTDKNKIEVIYSSSNVPGEGEHKLLQFIRNNKTQYNYAIYGLDADLIFLALSTGLNSIYLMREGNILKTKTEGFNYVSIEIMKDCIVDTMHKALIKCEREEIFKILDKKKLIDDFIFICYLIGNDFIPHMPSLDIYDGAINTLIDKYIDTIIEYPEQSIIIRNPTIDINTKLFYIFINKMAMIEEETLKINYNKKHYKIHCSSDDPYDIEVHKIENMKFKVNDTILLGSDSMNEWRPRYYKHHYMIEEKEIDDFSQKIVYQYMMGLKWIACYYFDKCPDWEWHYIYDHPPFLVDIIKYINNFSDIKFTLHSALSPFEQLLIVLPHQSSYLLPQCLQKIMLNLKGSARHLYPTKFELDMIGKKKYWMCTPILPSMDIDLIKRMFQKYSSKLYSDMREMNEIKEVLFF